MWLCLSLGLVQEYCCLLLEFLYFSSKYQNENVGAARFCTPRMCLNVFRVAATFHETPQIKVRSHVYELMRGGRRGGGSFAMFGFVSQSRLWDSRHQKKWKWPSSSSFFAPVRMESRVRFVSSTTHFWSFSAAAFSRTTEEAGGTHLVVM